MTFLATAPEDLCEMLTYARPHASAAEARFVDRFINPLPGIGYDKFGNGLLRIGTAPILWSSHTDTVHHKDGMQSLNIKGSVLSLANGARGQCLGADDGAGVWLMCEMIRAEVPGLYVFHAGEEHGGLGSSFIAGKTPDVLEGMDFAIAFDRKGTRDIITHQGQRTCSDAFAYALSAKLGMGYRPDDTGTFTDTANYADAIAECTNISVGYENAHSHGETLDIGHLIALRDVMVRFDPSGLRPTRYAGEIDQELAVTQWGRKGKVLTAVPANDMDTMLDLCRDFPEAAAELLSDLGIDEADLREAIWRCGYDNSLLT